MLYLGEERNEYEPCKLIIDKLELNDTNVLKGKSILNFGDSISAGDGNNGIGYSELLSNKNGMTCYDYAVGGATITSSIISSVIFNVILSTSTAVLGSKITSPVGFWSVICEYTAPSILSSVLFENL